MDFIDLDFLGVLVDEQNGQRHQLRKSRPFLSRGHKVFVRSRTDGRLMLGELVGNDFIRKQGLAQLMVDKYFAYHARASKALENDKEKERREIHEAEVASLKQFGHLASIPVLCKLAEISLRPLIAKEGLRWIPPLLDPDDETVKSFSLSTRKGWKERVKTKYYETRLFPRPVPLSDVEFETMDRLWKLWPKRANSYSYSFSLSSSAPSSSSLDF